MAKTYSYKIIDSYGPYAGNDRTESQMNEAGSTYANDNFVYDIGYLSNNNPYKNALFTARNKTDYKRVLTQAQQWEANQADYQRQLDDQRALRNEDRAYNSPASQVARDRAAGINPDLMGVSASSGGSSGGSAIPPQMQGTDLSDLSTPIETAGAVADVGNMVANVASSFTGGFSAITGAIQSIQSFQDVLGLTRANRRIAENNADISDTETPNRKLFSNMQTASNLASLMPIQKDSKGASVIPKLEEVSTFLGDFGISDPTMSTLAHKFLSSPEMKIKLDEMIQEQARQYAETTNMTSEFYDRFYQLSRDTELFTAESDFYSSRISSFLTSALSGDDNYIQNMISSSKNSALADKLASQNDVLDQSVRKDQLTLIDKMLKHDIKAFDESLKAVSQSIMALDRDILSKIDPKDSSIRANTLRTFATLGKQHLRSLGSTQLSTALGFVNNFQREYEIYRVFSGDKLLNEGGKTTVPVERRLGPVTMSWDHYVNNPASLSSILGTAVGSAISLYGIYKGSKGVGATSYKGWNSTPTLQ